MLSVSTCVYRIHPAASPRLLRRTTLTMSSPTRRGPTQHPSYAVRQLHAPLATVIRWRLCPWLAMRMALKMAMAIMPSLKMPSLMFGPTQHQTACRPEPNLNTTTMFKDTSTTSLSVFDLEAPRSIYTTSLRRLWIRSDGIVDCLSIGVALLLLMEDLVMHSGINSVYRLDHIEPRIESP